MQRTLLAFIGVTMCLVGVLTVQYPSSYLWAPWLWAGTAFGAGVLCLAAMCQACARRGRRHRLVGLAGAAVIAAAGSRAAVIALTALIDPPARPLEASFWIASGQWAMIAALAVDTWTHRLLPWSTMKGDAGGGG